MLRIPRLIPPREICAQRQREHLLVTEPDGDITRKQVGGFLAGNHHERRSWAADKGRRNQQGARRQRHGDNRVTAGFEPGRYPFKRPARKQRLGKPRYERR
jgi:hypothetical protein